MSDFRLEVFYTVARRLSFTKAAEALFITQPAVTKHIKELEERYGNKLFERKGNKIQLTAAGQLLLEHTESLFSVYRNIDFEMNALIHRKEGDLHLGASTTLAQYIIPPVLAGFRKKFSDIRLKLLSGNTGQIEKHLLDKEIELGIIEGRSRNPEIQYTEFMKDEIVLVCAKDHPLTKTGELEAAQLKEYKFVQREPGSGTLEVIAHALKAVDIRLSDLQVELELGGTEGIKSYLMHSDTLAFVSVHSLLKELQTGVLRIIDVKGLSIERNFYLIHLKGKADGLAEVFMRYVRQFHNLK